MDWDLVLTIAHCLAYVSHASIIISKFWCHENEIGSLNFGPNVSFKVLWLLFLEMCENVTHWNHFARCRHVYLTRLILYPIHVHQTADDFNTVRDIKHVELLPWSKSVWPHIWCWNSAEMTRKIHFQACLCGQMQIIFAGEENSI